MIAQTNQLQTNKQEFRWSCRKKGKNVLNFCQQLTFCLTLAGGLFMAASSAEAGPVGGNVVGGNATIAQSGANTNITQHSNRAIIEWSNFDINSGETVRFLQNSASSIALNRVINSQQATAINGNLLANGKVIVINPNGVVIGATGNIDVGGFVASTADIGNNDFMNATGAMNFNKAGAANGLIENNGRITINDAGLGLLVAPQVRNNGLIQGNMAKIQLAAGDTFGVDLYGDGLLHLAVAHPNTQRTLKAENTAAGQIVAQAGKVVMTAAAVNNTVNSVINNSGVIEAKGLVAKGGEIILTGEGADISVSGKIDASGKTGGGSIKIGGDKQGTGTLAKAKTVNINKATINTNNGGDVSVHSNGSLAVNSSHVNTNGGDVSLSSNGSLTSYASSFITGGGDLRFAAGGSMSLTNLNVNTSGGTGLPTLSFSATGSPKSFKTIFSDNGSTSTVNGSAAGNVIFTSNGQTHGSNVCVMAGGNGCAAQEVIIKVKANDLFITYGQPDPKFTYTYTGTLRGSDAFIGQLLRDAGLNVGTYKINQGSLNLASSNAASYVYKIDYTPGVLTINPALLTITAQDQYKPYGSRHFLGNSAITVNGLQYGDEVATATLTSNGAQADAPVGTYDINASNAVGKGSTDLNNYTIVYKEGTLTVNKINLTITANNRTKTYGDAFALGTTDFRTSRILPWDSVSSVDLSSLGAAAGVGVGTYTINAQNAIGTGLSNYNLIYASGSLTVNPALLTITAQDQYKPYGSRHFLGNSALDVTGLKNGDQIATATLTSNGAQADAPVGTYDINASNAVGKGSTDLNNYTIVYNPGTLTVNKINLTITANNRTKTYGDAFALGTTDFRTSRILPWDSVSSVDLNSLGAAAGAGVGTYTINAQNAIGTGLSNYNLIYASGSLTVNPALLTITARDQYKTYGDTKNVNNALFAYGVSGLKNNDRVTGVTLASTGAGATANVGDYDINASNATGRGLSNYTIAYNTGTLHVNPALLLITADSFSKTYGNTVNFNNNNYNVYGLKNSDTVNGVTLASNGAAATANVGLYGIFGSNATGTGLGNYSIVYTPGLLLVNPAALTITARDQSKTYGQVHNLGTTDFDVSGLKNSDNVASVNLSSAGAAGTANAGSYDIFANGAAGNGLSNYTITYNTGTLNVNKAALTVVANNQTKPFGNSFAFNGSEFSLVGTLYNGDTVNNATLSSTGAASNATSGLHNILIGNASGNGLANYDVTYQNGIMSVGAAPTNPTNPGGGTPPLASLNGIDPSFSINPLNRPVLSYANKVIVRDVAFEAYEVRTLNTDVAMRYTGQTSNTAAFLNAIQPAAGNDKSSPEDLANIEPAAGGAATPAASDTATLSEVSCANDFLDNRACQY